MSAFMAVVVSVALFAGIGSLAASTNPCLKVKVVWWPAVADGWHGDVKCYRGEVVDFRETP